MTRILLIGGTLRKNFGGPSIVLSLKKLLTDTLPDARIQVLAFWRKSRVESEGYVEVPFSPTTFLAGCLRGRLDPLRRILELYRWADVVIDYWGLSFTDAKKRGLLMRLMEGFPMLLGRILGKPVIKYTADMGPFVSRVNKWSAKFYLNRINLILARSNTTKSRLKELGVRTPVSVCPDTGLLLEPVPVSGEEFGSLNSAPLVGLSVSYVAEQKVGPRAYVTTMARLCDYLVEQMGAGVLVIPNEISPERPALDDVRVAREVFAAVSNKENVVVLAEEYSAPHLKGIIGACHVVIASRYHTVVAALSLGIPTISLSWHEKYRGLMALFGQEEHVCDLETLDIAALEQKVAALWVEWEDTHEEIVRHMPAVREEILKGAYMTRRIVEGLD